MAQVRFRGLWLLAALAATLGAGACTSTEGQCQRVCEWEDRCVTGAENVEDCAQQCVKDSEARSPDCEDAFDAFASCTGDNQSCAGVDKQCSALAARLVERCDCDHPGGPSLAVLCRGPEP